MQVKSKDGKRSVKLKRGEHTILCKARDICRELSKLIKDDDAGKAASQLDILQANYAPPEPKKRQATAPTQGAGK